MNLAQKLERAYAEIKNIQSHDDADVKEVEAALKEIIAFAKEMNDVLVKRRVGSKLWNYIVRIYKAFKGV